jgi:phosphate transport system permease protein
MESLPAFRIRSAQGVAWKLLFLVATVGVCLVFISLLLTTLNNTFGVVAYQNAVEPEDLVPGRGSLEELRRPELIGLLRQNLSTGMLRRLDSEEPLEERRDNELREIVQERIVEPEIVRSWTLMQSFFSQDAIAAYAEAHPDQDLAFRSWLTAEFLTSHQSSRPEDAGVRAALLGTIWIVLLAVVFAFPVGVLTAIYMGEYARRNIFTTLVSLNIQNSSRYG